MAFSRERRSTSLTSFSISSATSCKYARTSLVSKPLNLRAKFCFWISSGVRPSILASPWGQIFDLRFSTVCRKANFEDLTPSPLEKYKRVEIARDAAEDENRQKQQEWRPVDARRLPRRKDLAERPQEGQRHAAEDLVELIEDVVRALVAPPKRGLRGEKENPGNDHPDDHRPFDDRGDPPEDLICQRDERHQPRGPKMARPMRTMVDPSSIAA